MPAYAIPLVLIGAFAIIFIAICVYRRSSSRGNGPGRHDKDKEIGKWISMRQGEIVLSMEMKEHTIKVEDSFNPAFDIKRLPAQKQDFEQARNSIVRDTKKDKDTESGQDNESMRNPMKESFVQGSVRPNALASPRTLRQSEMRSPGKMAI